MKPFFFFFILLFATFFGACENKPQNSKEPGAGFEKTFVSEQHPVKATLKLTSDKPALNQTFLFVIQIDYGADIVGNFDFLPLSFFKPLKVTKKPRSELVYHNTEPYIWGRKIYYEIEANLPGKHLIPPFLINYKLKSEKPDSNLGEWKEYQIKTTALPLEVVPKYDDDQKQLKPVRAPEYPGFYLVPALMGGSVATALGILALMIYLRRGQNKGKLEKKPVDYWQVTMNVLAELENLRPEEQKEIEEFHVKLSSTLRQFIENYLGEKAEDLTTEEFIRKMLQSQTFKPEQTRSLREFMELSDIVKFAKFSPDPSVNQDSVLKLKEFVIASKKPTDKV